MKISLPVFKVNIYCIYINILELSWGKVHLNDGLVFLEEAHCPAVRVKNVSLLNHKIITSPGKNETIEGERERDGETSSVFTSGHFIKVEKPSQGS